MRMQDLVTRTGVQRETIHYYTREGLLPEIRKTSRNQAQYGPEHVERILLIKELQEKYFLPISIIKKVISEQGDSVDQNSLMMIMSEYLNPLDKLLPEKIEGEEAYLRVCGMSRERLADFEEYGIINPEVTDGHKVYSHDDLKIGKLIGDMRRLGVSHENGFRRDGLRTFRDFLATAIEQVIEIFIEGVDGRFSRDEVERLAVAHTELLPIFFYHTSHYLLKRSLDETLNKIRTLDGDASDSTTAA